MDDKLFMAIFEAGLLQFGQFKSGAQFDPFRENLHLLPAYPDILAAVANALLAITHSVKIERLVSSAAAVPLGTALSLKSHIPLVYSKGSDESPVNDLIGAYDVGHPALLVTNVLTRHNDGITRLLRNGRRVGLEIQQVAAVLQIGKPAIYDDVTLYSLFTLESIIEQSKGMIPQGQAVAVQKWLTS